MLDYMHHVLPILQFKVIKSSRGNLGSAPNNTSCFLMGLWDVVKAKSADGSIEALTRAFTHSCIHPFKAALIVFNKNVQRRLLHLNVCVLCSQSSARSFLFRGNTKHIDSSPEDSR